MAKHLTDAERRRGQRIAKLRRREHQARRGRHLDNRQVAHHREARLHMQLRQRADNVETDQLGIAARGGHRFHKSLSAVAERTQINLGLWQRVPHTFSHCARGLRGGERALELVRRDQDSHVSPLSLVSRGSAERLLVQRT